MTALELTYFDFSGSRGEECRLALHAAGVEFTDNRIDPKSWPDFKAETPFGSLPLLEVEGKGVLAQSNAILVYVGRSYGLHPSDPWQAAWHEQFLCAGEDLRGKVWPVLRIKGEERVAAREELASGLLQDWGRGVDSLLGEGPFVGGAELSVADIKLYMLVRWFASGSVDHVPADVFQAFPKLTALYDAVRTHPAVVSWAEKSAAKTS